MIRLHLGVHKTATTYLQDLLALNQGAIANAGRAYWRLDQIRQPIDVGLRECIARKGRRLAFLRNFGTSPIAPLSRLSEFASLPIDTTISEENILGFPTQALEGKLYAKARERLPFIRKALGDREVEIWLCLRAYPDFLSSLYAEALRHGYYASIEDFVARNGAPAGQWPELVRTIADSFPGSRIVVWAYEDFKSLMPQIIERLSGLPVAGLRPLPSGDVRPSASARAVELQSARAKAMTVPERMQSMLALEQQYPLDRSNEKFAPWPASTAESMRAAYLKDLEVIKAFEGVEFLTSGRSPSPDQT